MSIATILTMVGPLIVKFLGGIVNRFWNSGVTTLQGTAAGAAVIGLLQSFGCDLSLAQQALLGSLAALPGFLASDANRTATSLIEAAKQAALAAKQPLTPDNSVSNT